MEDSFVLTLENKEPIFRELSLCFCGKSDCHPDHSIGPAAHPNYVLHYILSGKGQYHLDGRTYTLEKDQGFIMEPNVVSSYKADHDEPWSYLWIGFEGSLAEPILEQLGLSHHSPTFSADCGQQLLSVVTDILKCEHIGIRKELQMQALLLRFFSCLADTICSDNLLFQREKQNYYVRAAEAFIRERYADDLKMQEIAQHVGISRGYLVTLFQNILHMSPSEYLANFRLTRAHEQLAITDLPISTIAEKCGYQNPLVFSRAFKKNDWYDTVSISTEHTRKTPD